MKKIREKIVCPFTQSIDSYQDEVQNCGTALHSDLKWSLWTSGEIYKRQKQNLIYTPAYT
jgi:hypothetical protein